MHVPDNNNSHADIARLLDAAVRQSGISHSEIARRANMKRDSVRRSLTGERPVGLIEALRILKAADQPAEETLLLALMGGAELAAEWLDCDATRFLGELFRQLPQDFAAQLSQELYGIRPRWALGAARLLTRTLGAHIAELAARDQAIGVARPSPPAGDAARRCGSSWEATMGSRQSSARPKAL